MTQAANPPGLGFEAVGLGLGLDLPNAGLVEALIKNGVTTNNEDGKFNLR